MLIRVVDTVIESFVKGNVVAETGCFKFHFEGKVSQFSVWFVFNKVVPFIGCAGPNVHFG